MVIDYIDDTPYNVLMRAAKEDYAMPLQRARWASIGAGVMATALFSGAAERGGLNPADVIFTDTDESKLGVLSKKGFQTTPDNAAAARLADFVLLAVKPGQAIAALRGIAPQLDGKVLVSVCAGITVAAMRAVLPNGTRIVRVMPNLPVTVGAGASAIAMPEGMDAKSAEIVTALFSRSGYAVPLDEGLLNAVTAVSGSGPGYFFRFAAAMQAEAEQQGIPPEAARNLIAHTMGGAARMLMESGASAKELANHVATPGGTTQAAFQVLDGRGFDESVRKAMARCAERARELGR